MGSLINLTGQKFQAFTVLSISNKRNNAGNSYWNCQCICGSLVIVEGKRLRNGEARSCGCLKQKSFKDLTGMRFGRLLVVNLDKERTTGKYSFWNVICDCGKTKSVRRDCLIRGIVVSCGCLKNEKLSQYALEKSKVFVGAVFGKLTVIEITKEKNKNGIRICRCLCSCGKEKSYSATSLGHARSCGCLIIENKNRGSEHWNWNGGITPENAAIRNSLESKQWRIAVFERDNYTCQDCGARSKKGLKKPVKLVAHHIKSFFEFSELRFDINNGITLCDDCHKKTDNFGEKAKRKK
jgi:5-methylcytosine-specific restriction endonuclease McrA